MLDTVELEEKALTWQKGEGRIEKVRGMGECIMSVKERGLREPTKHEARLKQIGVCPSQ